MNGIEIEERRGQDVKKLRIESIPISQLQESNRNANVMDEGRYQQLVKNIRVLGFLQPLLVTPSNGKYIVHDGNHRLRAGKEVGYKNLPCVVGETPKDVSLALGLGMNNLRGEVDLTIASEMIQELASQGWKTNDLLLTGFSEEELATLLKASNEAIEEVEEELETKLEEDAEQGAPNYEVAVEFGSKARLQFFRRALRRASRGKGRESGALAMAALVLDEKAP